MRVRFDRARPGIVVLALALIAILLAHVATENLIDLVQSLAEAPS